MPKILIVDDEPEMRVLLEQTFEELEEKGVELLTARVQEVDREKGKDVGADFYIIKPFDPDEIIKKAAEVLEIEIQKT